MRVRQILLAMMALSFGIGSQATRADMIIELENARRQAGQSGFIDIYVRSTDIDQIDQYSVRFNIEHIRGQGIMEFSQIQDSYETLSTNYIFAQNSEKFVSDRNENQLNRMTQSDATFFPGGVTIGSGLANRRLLGRLEFSHIVPGDALANFPGAEYRVSIVRTGDFTFFTSNDFSDSVAIAEVSYSNFGTIQVVPEPSAVLVLATAFSVVTFLRRR